MPIIGEVRSGREIGHTYYNKCIWHACIDCGKERWVRIIKGQPHHLRCKACTLRQLQLRSRGEGNGMWKGGRRKAFRGYIEIWLSKDDFFYPMATRQGYVREHRLVVAKALGRCLHPWEIVHHKKGYAKDDNRYPETLQLVSDTRHNQITILENRIRHLEKRVTLLEAENALLKAGTYATNL